MPRITPERLAEIRSDVSDDFCRSTRSWVERSVRELLRELDAVTAERNNLDSALDKAVKQMNDLAREKADYKEQLNEEYQAGYERGQGDSESREYYKNHDMGQ